MNVIASILDAIDGVTGSNERNGTHTFTIAAPMCVPIRHLWKALYKVGIRGKWQPIPSVLTFQTARLTVSTTGGKNGRGQAEYTSLLLWKQACVWEGGLNIRNDPWRNKSLTAIGRNGYQMPQPWEDKNKEWRQPSCKKPRR